MLRLEWKWKIVGLLIKKVIRLLNIMYRCEDGTISNDPPATIIGLEVPPSMILENILFQVL